MEKCWWVSLAFKSSRLRKNVVVTMISDVYYTVVLTFAHSFVS